MSDAHSFDEVTAWDASGPNTWTGVIAASWMQGRAAYGGLVSAAALRAMRSRVARGRTLRSLSTHFIGPVEMGAASVTVTVLRAGRFMTRVEARVTQGERLCALLFGEFGESRSSGLRVVPNRRPVRPDPAEIVERPHLPGRTPNFIQHLAFRWTDGGAPFSGDSRAEIGGWCRFRGAAGGVEGVIGLLDAWPAPVLPMLTRPCPASTVRWNAHIVADVPAPSRDWWWFQASTVSAHDGYATTRGHLYGPEGGLVAWMEQLVAVFDSPASSGGGRDR